MPDSRIVICKKAGGEQSVLRGWGGKCTHNKKPRDR